ncbi:hypothetical protein [Shewanella waksmanii]|nr:hypothetical protein [Shewanella waksmanii]
MQRSLRAEYNDDAGSSRFGALDYELDAKHDDDRVLALSNI